MITVVSGLPRSGTSMMMQMLEAGGLPVYTDGERPADPSNPRGYYEVERAKRLKQNSSWLDEVDGKAVKAVSMLLLDLPASRRYRVIFLLRDLDEILASQAAMLKRLGQANGPPDAKMRAAFESHLAKVRSWLDSRENMEVLYCRYDEVVRDPRACAEKIARFLRSELDVDRMARAVDPALYRERFPPKELS